MFIRWNSWQNLQSILGNLNLGVLLLLVAAAAVALMASVRLIG